MLINTKHLTIASILSAAALWTVCSILVALSPGPMTTMTGHMIHMDLAQTGLTMNFTGFIVGLIGWTILAGGFAWLLGHIYNYAASKST